jgi:hypothetical protein
MTSDPAKALRFRSPTLVLELLGYVYDADEPIPWNELLGVFGLEQDRPVKTVENALYDLVAFGALHRVGKVSRREDTRALKPTPLGRAWLDRELLPQPGERDDPILEADRLAHELEPDLNLLEHDVSTTIGTPDETEP